MHTATLELAKILDRKLSNYFNNHLIVTDKALRKEFPTFLDYLDNIVSRHFSSEMSKTAITDMKNDLYRNIRKSKIRWAADVNKNPKIKEKYLNETLKVKGLDIILKDYNVNSIEEYYNKIDVEVEKWKEDKSSYLIDFIYFNYKAKGYKLKAFENDLIFSILNIICSDFGNNFEWLNIKIASELIDNPIFSPKQTLRKYVYDDDTEEELDNQLMPILDDYIERDNYILKTLYKDTDRAQITTYYTLDQIDQEIISLCYSKIKGSHNFYKDRTIRIDLRDLVKQVTGHVTVRNMDNIENRIKKISKFHTEITIKSDIPGKRDTYLLINFFEKAIIEPNVSGKTVIFLTFGQTLFDSYIKQQTYKISSYDLKSIKNKLSRLLVPSLQKERLNGYASKTYEIVLDFDYFINRVRFREQTKTKIIKSIDAALIHLKENNVLISKVEKVKNHFNIEFLPLTEKEKLEFGIYEEAENQQLSENF